MTTLAEYEDGEAEQERIMAHRQARGANGRFVKICWSCGVYESDAKSGLCVGCEAYRDHQR